MNVIRSLMPSSGWNSAKMCESFLLLPVDLLRVMLTNWCRRTHGITMCNSHALWPTAQKITYEDVARICRHASPKGGWVQIHDMAKACPTPTCSEHRKNRKKIVKRGGNRGDNLIVSCGDKRGSSLPLRHDARPSPV